MSDHELIRDHSSLRRPCYFCAAKNGNTVLLYNELIIKPVLADRNLYANMKVIDEDGEIYTLVGIAAKQGCYDLVEMLLDVFSIEIDMECTVIIHGNLVPHITPLWCAARMGHLSVVKLLASRGAMVNSRFENSFLQPLRGACESGNVDIVRYLMEKGADIQKASDDELSCLMIAARNGSFDMTLALLENGAIPNDQNAAGETALHYASKFNFPNVCRLLLDNGALLLKNNVGLTPQLLAAIKTYDDLVQLYINWSDLLTKSEKIDCLELIGSTYCTKSFNKDTTIGYTYLEKAMQMRFENPNIILKTIVAKPCFGYNYWKETKNLSELQAISPVNNNSMSIYYEALVIRERILGENYIDLYDDIFNIGIIFIDSEYFNYGLNLWLHAINIRQINHKSSAHSGLIRTTQIFYKIVEEEMVINLITICKALIATINEIKWNENRLIEINGASFRQIYDKHDRNVIILFELITIIAHKFKPRNKYLQRENYRHMYKLITKIVIRNVKCTDGKTLLHMATDCRPRVKAFLDTPFMAPCRHTIALLLKCRASLNQSDIYGNTPLHLLTETIHINFTKNYKSTLYNFYKILKIFGDHGVHFDAVNKANAVASSLCNIPEVCTVIKTMEMTHSTLQCKAARVIGQYRIPYKNEVPQTLHKFIEMHSSEKD